jgi:hypothetical protein
VPCNVFLYPEIDYGSNENRLVERDFHFNRGAEPGYPPPSYGNPTYSGYYQSLVHGMPPIKYDQLVKNTMYDKYGRMLFLQNIDKGYTENRSFLDYRNSVVNAPVRIPYYRYEPVNSRMHKFKTIKKTNAYSIRHGKNSSYQGMNDFQDYVKENSACAGHAIHKNEIDDYMIGILLCINDKLIHECPDDYMPFRPKWILFSHDKYSWMNPRLIANVEKQSNFIKYINETHINPIKLYHKNTKSGQIIQQIGLNQYHDQLTDFIALLKGIISLNKT